MLGYKVSQYILHQLVDLKGEGGSVPHAEAKFLHLVLILIGIATDLLL